MKASSPLRQSISNTARFAARLCFAGALYLIPVRYQVTLAARPISGVSSGFTDIQLYAADFAVLFTLLLWAAALALSPRTIEMGPRYVWIPLAGLTLAAAASIPFSYDPLLSIYHVLRLAVLFCLFVFVVNEVRLLAWILTPIGLQVASQSIVALAQFFAQHSIGLQVLSEASLDPAQPGVSVVVSNGVRLLRAYGLSDHPNILGGCLAFGSLLLLAAYLHARKPWLALAALLLAGPALLVTFSRSAWIAFLLGAGALFLLEAIGRRGLVLRRFLALGAAWIVLCAPLILVYRGYFGARVNAGNSFSTPSVEQQSVGERLLLIDTYLPIFLRHPVVGVGIGTAPLALKANRPDWPVAFEPPHVALLDAALETGVLGAAFYLMLIAGPLVAFLLHRRTAFSDLATSVSLALLLAVAAVGLFDYYTWMLLPGRLWQWFAWGLWSLAATPGALSLPALADRTFQQLQPELAESTI